MMLAKFRHHYPQGSLLSELVKVDRGLFIVKVSIQVQDKILATALASADCVEAAEDKAQQRAIAALVLDSEPPISSQSVISKSSSPTKSRLTSISSPSSVQSSQPALTLESTIDSIGNHTANHNLVNHNNVVDIADHQTEMINQHPISEQTIDSPTPMAELSTPQANVGSQVKEKIQPTTDTSSLFDEVLPSETSEKGALNDLNHTIAATSLPEINSESKIEVGEIDFNEIKQKTDIEIKRLGWTKENGRDFLKSRYGKRSRLHLTDDQLLEFLHYLESLPSPS